MAIKSLLRRVPVSVEDQAEHIRAHFPEIARATIPVEWSPPSPSQASWPDEGWFVVPRWETVAPTYLQAVDTVLGRIHEISAGGFKKYLGNTANEFLRQSSDSRRFWNEVAKRQSSSDLLVVHAQLGRVNRGQSVESWAKHRRSHEVGLGAFAVGVIILTHMEHFFSRVDLDFAICCPGDHCTYESSPASLDYVPNFRFFGSGRGAGTFGLRWVWDPWPTFGMASAFFETS